MSSTISQELQRTTFPPLENADRLTRPEFERRYAAMPGTVKAELIDGVVYVPSPTRHKRHGRQHARLIWFFGAYIVATPGTDVGDNSSLRMDLDNEPQPDGLLRLVENVGGQFFVDEEDYLSGAPELIGEITSSSVSRQFVAELESRR